MQHQLVVLSPGRLSPPLLAEQISLIKGQLPSLCRQPRLSPKQPCWTDRGKETSRTIIVYLLLSVIPIFPLSPSKKESRSNRSYLIFFRPIEAKQDGAQRETGIFISNSSSSRVASRNMNVFLPRGASCFSVCLHPMHCVHILHNYCVQAALQSPGACPENDAT